MIPLQVRNQETGEIEIEVKKVCYCKDISGFTEYVKEERDIEGDIDIKIGIDGGGGSFKVTKNAIEKKQQNANADDLKSPPKKRTAKHQKKRYKDSGVKKLFIICIVEGILETYDNVKTILNLVKIDKIDFVIATDLKLANILLGLSSHSSKFRCPYCNIPFGDFHLPHRKPCRANLRDVCFY